MRVGFCVSGQGRLFQLAVDHHRAIGIEPALLITDESASDLSPFCARHGIATVRLGGTDRLRFEEALVRACSDARLDFMMLTFNRIVPRAIVAALPRRIVNVHLSLLPAFRGFGAVAGALVAGVKIAGVTLHEVSDDVDGGPPICQAAVAVRPDDTVDDLGRRMYSRLQPMYLQTLAWYAERRVYHDERGGVWVKNATYDDASTSPAIEARIAGLLKDTPERTE